MNALQQEKIDVINLLLKEVDTNNSKETTSVMLKRLKSKIESLIITDF